MVELKRSLSVFQVMFYGLGTILGAGIYVLTGVVAGHAGVYTPFAFVLAAIVAAPTALSYAELASRLPRSAGEAVYVDAAFSRDWLTKMTGLAVAMIGIVSAATIARGFVGYLDVFVLLPDTLVVIVLVSLLGGLAAWGISESVWVAVGVTVVELLGLLFVNAIGFEEALGAPAIQDAPGFSPSIAAGVLAGAFLAFYAFIGFEDMVNVAEEVRNPTKNIPYAIVGALSISTLLYFITAWVVVRSVPLEELAGSHAPLALVVERNSEFSPKMIAAVSLLAVVNGALVQIIMASRVLYGMAVMERLPPWLGRVLPRTQTPVNATTVTTSIILLLAVFFDLEMLASVTSALTLLVFVAVNAALLVIKRRGPEAQEFRVPAIVPVFGATASLLLFAGQFAGG